MAGDRDVIAEPVIRLRAETASLKADLEKAKAEVKSATTEIARDAAKALVEGLEKKLAGVGSALSKAEKTAAREAKAIQGHLDKLNATQATKSMGLLEKAVASVGGTSKLSAEQVAILTRQVERLAAAGAKVPKTLTVPKSGGLGVGATAAIEQAAGGLAPGGALGAGLQAIGPAGLVAAAGIGAVTIAAKTAFEAIKNLASQAEQWSNVATTTGLGVVQVQQLQAYLEDAGFSSEDLGKAMKKMATEIAGGGDSLAKFGIDVRELKGLAPEEQFRELARQVTAIVDPTERAAAATEAFGKGGAKALAGLQGVASGAYKELGALNEKAITDLLAVDAELDKAARAWTNWKNEALVALIRVAEQINKNADPANLFKIGATPAEINAGDKANRAAALRDTQDQIAAGLAQRAKAAALAREKKDAAEAEGRAAKALAERERRENEYAALKRKLDDQFLRGMEERAKAEEAAARADERRQLAEIAIAKAAHEGTQQLMADTEAQVGINEKLLQALQAVGPPAEGAQIALEDLAKDVIILGGAGALSAEQLEVVRQKIASLQSQGAKKLPDALKTTVDYTRAWVAGLSEAAALLNQIGGKAGSIGNIFGGIAGGLSGIKNLQATGAKGGLEGLLGGIGAAGQIASAAIGIGKAIVGLFKSDPVKKAQQEAGKALGYGISRELAQTLLDHAKSTGQSITQVAKAYAAKVQAEQASANRQQLEAGIATAKQGAEDLSGLLDKFGPAAQAAGGALVKAVADAMAANGLGVLQTGALAKSDKFSAVQQAVGAAGQITQGLRQAGGIDTNFLANGGAFAEALRQEAVAAAKEAGLSDAEAQKAGLAAIAPLLKDQLNASIESGKELSAQQKALLDEAKANGIEIVADPLLAQLEVQKSIDATLRGIAGQGGGLAGAGGTKGEFTQRRSAAAGIPGLFTGPSSPRLDLQLHPNEMLTVTPGVTSASLAGGFSASGASSTPDVTYGPGSIAPTIIIPGSGLSQGQLSAAVADAMNRVLREGTHPVNATLRRQIGGRA